MPFVNAKCPNCGGTLQVDNSKRAAMCPYCKEAYVVEDAINNYITNNYTTVEHLHADVVNFNANPDFEIRAGELVAYHGNAVDVVIPDGVKKIGGFNETLRKQRGAFENCSFLRSVTIPDSVEEIGANAFLNCTRLKSVQFPYNLEEIGDAAFAGCKSLSQISFLRISKRLKIGRSSFAGCTELTELTLPHCVESIDQRAFYGCGITTLHIQGNPTIEKLGYADYLYDNDNRDTNYRDRSPFAGCPIKSLSATEEWEKEYCWNFPKVLGSYCKESRRLELQSALTRYQKRLAEHEEQYCHTGLFAKSERARIKSEIESNKLTIANYQKAIAESDENLDDLFKRCERWTLYSKL